MTSKTRQDEAKPKEITSTGEGYFTDIDYVDPEWGDPEIVEGNDSE
jgi:hypothetical protein